MNIKWKMWSSSKFTSEYEDYSIIVEPPYWFIKQQGSVIDCCFLHSKTTGELQAKVQAERALKEIISKNINNSPGDSTKTDL